MKVRVEVVCLNAAGDERRRQVLTIERRELAMETLGMNLTESKALLQACRICSRFSRRMPNQPGKSSTSFTVPIRNAKHPSAFAALRSPAQQFRQPCPPSSVNPCNLWFISSNSVIRRVSQLSQPVGVLFLR